MTSLHQPKSEALRALFWREEILQVMFWIQGEGLGERVDPATLERFLGVEASHLAGYLEEMVADGLLEPEGESRYRLSERGRAEGGRIFADEFAHLTRPAHGECGPDCWCHVSVEEAEACATERSHTHR